jgi:hypothetical protein
MQQQKFAPVASYRGVAILERTGDKVAVWNGQEYKTDGLTHIWANLENNGIETLGFPHELVAKYFLDSLTNDQLQKLCTWEEALRFLHVSDPETFQRRFRFDDVSQVFVQI